MPDEIVFGRMRISRAQLLRPAGPDPDFDRVLGIAKVDCQPPPGAVTDFVRPGELAPVVIERFIQMEERIRLGELGREVNQTDSTDDTIGRILGGLGLKPLPVVYGLEYRALIQVVPCYTVDVFLRVEYDVYEIRVTADKDLTLLGGAVFPAGDELATFRAAEARRYRFETLLTFNPRCCDKEPEVPPGARQSEWLPRLPEPERRRWNLDPDWFDDWRPGLRPRRDFGG